jgi:putative membrane protein
VAASPASLLAALLVAEVVAMLVSPKVLAAAGSTFVVSLITLAPLVWRRIATEYGFTVAESPDGLRIRRGLLGTVAETIPLRRVQAVRMVEPAAWRPLGWCRLEIDVAGSPGRDHADGSGRMRKTLLPVGHREPAWELIRLVIGSGPPRLSRPPRRARRKALLSYHFLAAGHDATTAMGVTGRLRKVTTWVPLEKVQSVRMVTGPVQRALSLATVHVDAAGRRVRAEFRDRPADEAAQLVGDLAALSRSARRRAPGPGGPLVPVIPAQASAEPSPASGSDPLGEDSARQPGPRR